MRNCLWSTTVLLGTLALSQPAGAQLAPLAVIASGNAQKPSDAAAPTAGDIIVTARKQGETALTAPATITILDAKQIEASNVTNANQLNGIVPGLTMSPGASAGGQTTFRGLGSNGSTSSVESSVAAYIDGVYLGHTRDYVTPLYDLDHIEFIKGTQSTLLGKNTSLGAVSIVNRRPTKNFSLNASYAHSFTIDGDRITGAMNVPLSANLSVRGAFFYSDEAGWLRNTFTRNSAQRLRDISGRLSFAYRPDNGPEVIGIYQHDDRRARGQNLLVISDPAGVVARRASQIGQADFRVGISRFQNDASAPLVGTPASVGAFDRQRSDRLNLIVSAPLGALTLTSQTAYTRWRSPRQVDFDFLAANLYNLVDDERNRVLSEELRISSSNGGRLRYLGGVYLYDNWWGLRRGQFVNPNTIAFALTGFNDGDFNERTTAYSAFASTSYELVTGLRISAGLRYTHETKSATFVRNGTPNLGGLTGTSPNVPFTQLPKIRERPTDGDVGAQYQARRNLLLYASYSKGSKSGGFQETPRTLAGAAFSGETAYTAEVGAKLNLRASGYLTLSAFNTRIKNFQTTTTSLIGVPPVSQSTVGNSQVRSRGFETTASLRVLPELKVIGSLAYQRARFTENFLPVAAAGDRLVKAPDWSGNLALVLDTPLNDDVRFTLQPSVDFASKALLQLGRLAPDSPIAVAHQLVNLRASLMLQSRGLEVAVLGTNLNNQIFANFATTISNGGSAIGQRAFYGGINRPRTVALEISIRR